MCKSQVLPLRANSFLGQNKYFGINHYLPPLKKCARVKKPIKKNSSYAIFRTHREIQCLPYAGFSRNLVVCDRLVGSPKFIVSKIPQMGVCDSTGSR